MQLVRASSEMVAYAAEDAGAKVLGTMTPDVAADLLQRARLVAKAAEDAVEIVRAEVAAAGGSLTLSDGRTLQLTKQERRKIIPEKAWDFLGEALGFRLTEAVSISKSKVETIFRSMVSRGRKGAAVADLIKNLEEIDALETETVERLEIVRPTKKISEEPVTTGERK